MRVMSALMNPFDSIRQAPRSFVYGPSQSTIFFETVKREYDKQGGADSLTPVHYT